MKPWKSIDFTHVSSHDEIKNLFVNAFCRKLTLVYKINNFHEYIQHYLSLKLWYHLFRPFKHHTVTNDSHEWFIRFSGKIGINSVAGKKWNSLTIVYKNLCTSFTIEARKIHLIVTIRWLKYVIWNFHFFEIVTVTI